MCVELIDVYTSLVRVPLHDLQLLGVAALLVASKFLEKAPSVSTPVFLVSESTNLSKFFFRDLVCRKSGILQTRIFLSPRITCSTCFFLRFASSCT